MAEINDEFKDVPILTDYSAPIPEEYSPSAPAPYPGDYVFQLPKDLSQLWQDIGREIGPEGEKQKVRRVELRLTRDDALLIVEVPKGDEYEKYKGQGFDTRINNAERNRARKNESPVYVSDMTYMLRVLDPAAKPKSNDEFKAAMNKHGGKKLIAGIEWRASCSPDRQIYVEQEEEGGGLTLVPAVDDQNQPVMGCDQAYYMNQWPRDPATGKYKPSFACKCGNILRPFGQLRNFRAVRGTGATK